MKEQSEPQPVVLPRRNVDLESEREREREQQRYKREQDAHEHRDARERVERDQLQQQRGLLDPSRAGRSRDRDVNGPASVPVAPIREAAVKAEPASSVVAAAAVTGRAIVPPVAVKLHAGDGVSGSVQPSNAPAHVSATGWISNGCALRGYLLLAFRGVFLCTITTSFRVLSVLTIAAL